MNLAIRKMKNQDLEPLYILLSNPEVMKYLEPPFTKQQTGDFFQSALSDEPRVFAAEADGSFIGYVIYHPYEEDTMELGWVLLPEYWGKGFASALTRQMMDMAAAAGKKPVIECDPAQEATKHIALKYGFVRAENRDGLDVYRLPG